MRYKQFKIGSRLIGDSYPPLVIAEIGINHEGSLDAAIEIADAAINVGAEVIKHQTHIIEDEMSYEAKKIIPGNSDQSIFEIMTRCALSEKDEFALMNYVNSKNCIFISTPFSRAAVDRLVKFDIPAFKIGSGECNNYPLIKYIVKFKKPIILSTGMNNIDSIKPAVKIIRDAGIPYALLHCTNIYPTPPELVRLGALSDLKKIFPDAVIGLSDHTISNHTCFGAVALGACILERHFTDNMSRPGPDIVCSSDQSSLKDLIIGSKNIFLARGGKKEVISQEKLTKAFAFSSVVAIKDIIPGEKLGENNIWVMRPSGGDFSASEYEGLFGKIARNKILSGYQIKKKDLL